jgi:hypothetical protein
MPRHAVLLSAWSFFKISSLFPSEVDKFEFLRKECSLPLYLL